MGGTQWRNFKFNKICRKKKQNNFKGSQLQSSVEVKNGK